jgi:hypothetical protein
MKYKATSVMSWMIGMLASAALVGCSGSVDDVQMSEDAMDAEELGELEQTLNAACGSSTPQATYTGRITPARTISAANQSSGCQGNSFIIDINDYNVGSPLLLTPRIGPVTIPTTQAACEGSNLRYYVWEKSGATVTFLDSEIRFGVWEGAAFGCRTGMLAPIGMEFNHDYRIAVTARSAANANVPLVIDHPAAPQ